MEILPGTSNPVAGSVHSYYKYINSRHLETGKNALCIEWLCNFLPARSSICEHFGGVGVFATIIEELLAPNAHYMYDLDQECLNQLAAAFPYAIVKRGDAREIIGKIPADVFIFDWPGMTAKRYANWETQIEAMFNLDPLAVVWMDGAIKYLHFHKDRYAAILGEKIETNEDYTKAFSKFLFKKHGYSIATSAYQPSCSYFLITPGYSDPEAIEFKRFTDGHKGLRFV